MIGYGGPARCPGSCGRRREVSLWRGLIRGFRTLVNGGGADREVDEEIAHFVEQETAERVAAGDTPDDARRAARLSMGGELRVREDVRGSGWEHALETVLADLRYALRRLRGEPGFSLSSILLLGLGIGATTAIFSTVHPVLFDPLPYPGADRLAMVWETGEDGEWLDGTFGMYRELQARARTLEALAAIRPWQPTLSERGTPERLEGQLVSASWFRVLGVAPSLGRPFTAVEDTPESPRVVVLSDGLWRRRFGAEPSIVGQAILLDGEPHTIVGIMPATFDNVLAPAAEVWAPLRYGIEQGRAWGHHLRLVARLGDGATFLTALREIGVVGQSLIDARRPETYGPQVSFAIVPLREQVTAGVKPVLVAIFGAVALLMLIACANVANLQLARGVRRRSEFALRRALGAAQGRLVRQLLIENLVLALAGAVLGVMLAGFGVRWLVAMAPPNLPRLEAVGVDATALLFSLTIATITGLSLGIVPALRAAREDPAARLDHAAFRVAGGDGARGALVVGEIALALVLLASAGLLLKSVQRLIAVDPGFEPAGLLSMQIPTAGRRFESRPRQRRPRGGSSSR